MLTAALGAAAATAYVFLFLPAAYFRFDDFWQINSSVVHGGGLGEIVSTANEADGRWNPGMRVILWLIARVAGIEQAWPFYAVLAAVHALNVVLAVRLSEALGADARGRWATALVGVAGLNFSAYSLTSIFLLHGVASLSFALAAVLSAARYAVDRKPWRLAVCTAATLGGLLCKEYAVIAPLLAVVAVAAVAREPRRDIRLWAAIVMAFAVAGAAFIGLQMLAGVQLVPARGRYAMTAAPAIGRTLLWFGAHVSVWVAIPALMAWRRADRARAAQASRVCAALVICAVLPMLLLPWRSPGHLYLVLFSTAVGAGLLVTASRDQRSPLWHLWTATAIAVCLVVGTVAARHQILRWGPLTRQALDDWRAQRDPGDARVVWFDADWAAPYGGLADLVGPGIRLREALQMITGEPIPDAAICIDLVVGPAYVPMPGDALFLHADGRLRRVGSPPLAGATCLP